MLLVGTASWTDPTLLEAGWYPPGVARSAERRLRHYAERFPTVEVDANHHGRPRAVRSRGGPPVPLGLQETEGRHPNQERGPAESPFARGRPVQAGSAGRAADYWHRNHKLPGPHLSTRASPVPR